MNLKIPKTILITKQGNKCEYFCNVRDPAKPKSNCSVIKEELVKAYHVVS